jgi:hypothetical protein
MNVTLPQVILPQVVLRKQNRFLQVYFIALLMAFSPSKAIGQIAPLVVLFGLIFYVQLRPKHHLVQYGVLAALYVGVGLFYQLLMTDFWWPTYLLFLVTNSALLFLLYDYAPITTPDFIRRLGNWTLLVIFVQSVYGILQYMVGLQLIGYTPSLGDIVWGTLAPPVDSAYAGTGPFFVILISTLALAVLATTSRRLGFRTLFGLTVVVLCWTVASLVHSVVYFLLGAIFAVLWLRLLKFFTNRRATRRKRKQGGIFAIVILVVILFGAGTLVHPANYQNVTRILGLAGEFGPNASQHKLRVIYYTLVDVPKSVALQPLIGLGPGQYSSRAALMGTGEYLQRASIPFIEDHINPLTEFYIIPTLEFTRRTGGSSLDSPASSWIAVYAETGVFGVLAVAAIYFMGIMRFGRYQSEQFPRMSFAMLTLATYVLLMGFQNVYWEYTQAIFPTFMVLKICYDYLRVEHRQLRHSMQPVRTAHSPFPSQPVVNPIV